VRILFLSMEYPPETGGGGIGSYVATIAPALVERGHEVHVLSCVPGQAATDTVDRGVWIHRRGQVRVKGSSRVLRRFMPNTVPRVLTALSTRAQYRRLGIQFDVVEAPEWMAEGLLFGGRPVVAHLHTPLHVVAALTAERPPERDVRIADRLERASVTRAQIATAPSRLLRDHLRRSGWLDGTAASIVRNPVDVERWASSAPVEGTARTILSVGRLERRKSPETLVDAVASLGRTVAAVEAMFVGASTGRRGGRPYRVWLEERAHSAGASCRFVDARPRSDLAGWYGKARLVAVTSVFDNFPMAGLEAMAAGRAVVCTSGTGLAELVEGTEAGAVVETGDANGLANALKPYIVDAAFAARAGRAARRLVARECSPAVVAAARERCYVAAVDRWASGRGKPN
jgi:glycogen(starch) synthase